MASKLKNPKNFDKNFIQILDFGLSTVLTSNIWPSYLKWFTKCVSLCSRTRHSQNVLLTTKHVYINLYSPKSVIFDTLSFSVILSLFSLLGAMISSEFELLYGSVHEFAWVWCSCFSSPHTQNHHKIFKNSKYQKSLISGYKDWYKYDLW